MRTPQFFSYAEDHTGGGRRKLQRKIRGIISWHSDASQAEEHTATTLSLYSAGCVFVSCGCHNGLPHTCCLTTEMKSLTVWKPDVDIHFSGQNAGVGKTPLPPEALERIRSLPLPTSGCCGILCLWPSLQSLRPLHIAFSSACVISLPLPYGDICGWI